MDDPWGSPWTSNNDDFGSFASASTASPGPKPPQPALLAKISTQDLNSSSSKPPTLSFSSLEPSPWADDDNFGDWAAADSGTASTVNTANTASLGWADAFDDNKLSPRPKARSSQPSPQLGPVQWPTSIARPPGALTMRSRASSTFSRASDPWGAPKEDVYQDQKYQNGQKDEIEKKDEDLHVNVDAGADAKEDVADDASFASFEAADSRTESHVDPDHDHRDDQHEDEDGHGEPQQDSPTTSVDADRDDKSNEEDDEDDNEDLRLENSQDKRDGPHYPALRRTPSAKVQGLVELFDGLAKRPISASESAGSRSVSAVRSVERRPSRQLSIQDLPEDEQEEAEEKDIKEAVENSPESAPEFIKPPPPEPSPSEQSQPEQPQLEQSSSEPLQSIEAPQTAEITVETIGEQLESPPGTAANAVAQPEKNDEETEDTKDIKETKEAPTTPIPSADTLLALYGKQEPYAVDIAEIDALFSSFPVHATTPRADDADLDAFIPDGYILDDSFTNIAERRVWYRIARHGSSRKHNAGGGIDAASDADANYRPVTWATSTTRLDTVKIVRRWMEEDSFTGKPTLGAGLYSGGGGARGINMFGWDSAAEPVTLDQVFKRPAAKSGDGDKARGHTHSRTMSNTPPAASSAAAASAFGWGSDAPVSRAPREAPLRHAVRHSVHFGGFPSLGSFGEGDHNVWAAAAENTGKAVSPTRPSFDSGFGSGSGSGSNARTTPSLGSLPPPPKLVSRPSPLSISTVIAKPDVGPDEKGQGQDGSADDDDDDDDEWGEMVMSPTAGESSGAALPVPTPLPVSLLATMPAPAAPAAPAPSIAQQVPILAPPAKPASTPETSTPLDVSSSSLVDSIINHLPDLSYMSV